MTHSMQGFYQLPLDERIKRLQSLGYLDENGVALLQDNDSEYTALADYCIENAVGTFALPLGIATYFKIDGREYAIPMAVEESSIIAAASRAAKWVQQQGYLTTQTLGHTIIGQIQIAQVKNVLKLQALLTEHKARLIKAANETVLTRLVARGGGVTDIQLRTLKRPDFHTMAVLHVHLNPCDAMGANFVTQVCEFLKPTIEQLTGEKVTMCIVSNLCDSQLVRAEVCLKNIEPALGEAIAEAGLFAELDPYRAATHNKGIMNGIDAVLLATGNDWRAVEAGVHAFAARNGQYSALTQWRWYEQHLVGTFTAPINVGTVGGMTRLHPMAKLSLKLLGVQHAHELARIVAAVGLIQNLSALHTLVGPGLVSGHMKLHINNLMLAVGAKKDELTLLNNHLQQHLKNHHKVSESDAQGYLAALRQATQGLT